MISLRIVDDGRGFPPHLLGRIGDPFVGRRKNREDRAQRPEYEGMGLGLFIAKTLLERSGAELNFSNGSDPYTTRSTEDQAIGAIVEVQWKRSVIDPRQDDATVVGKNQHITA